jgi:hypothetical protein
VSEWVDDEGYPTEAMLEKIEKWDASEGSYNDLMKFIKPYWRYSFEWYWSETEYESEGIEYSISTGGWSGNEDIIRALQMNRLFWCLYWLQSRRGGHYIFKVKDYEQV